MLKREREGNDSLEADMWCHFGAAIIRGASAGNLRFIYLYTWLTCYITNLRRNWPVEMVHCTWTCLEYFQASNFAVDHSLLCFPLPNFPSLLMFDTVPNTCLLSRIRSKAGLHIA